MGVLTKELFRPAVLAIAVLSASASNTIAQDVPQETAPNLQTVDNGQYHSAKDVFSHVSSNNYKTPLLAANTFDEIVLDQNMRIIIASKYYLLSNSDNSEWGLYQSNPTNNKARLVTSGVNGDNFTGRLGSVPVNYNYASATHFCEEAIEDSIVLFKGDESENSQIIVFAKQYNNLGMIQSNMSEGAIYRVAANGVCSEIGEIKQIETATFRNTEKSNGPVMFAH